MSGLFQGLHSLRFATCLGIYLLLCSRSSFSEPRPSVTFLGQRTFVMEKHHRSTIRKESCNFDTLLRILHATIIQFRVHYIHLHASLVLTWCVEAYINIRNKNFLYLFWLYAIHWMSINCLKETQLTHSQQFSVSNFFSLLLPYSFYVKSLMVTYLHEKYLSRI